MKAAMLTAMGRSAPKVAEAVGVHERTVRRWRAAPRFRAVVARFRDDAVGDASGILSATAAAAADTLRLMLDPAKSDTVRLAAARAILSDLLSVREFTELAARVEDLEGRLKLSDHRALHTGGGHN